MQREKPGPGQESVWDYPRPPKLELSRKIVRVMLAGQMLAESSNAYRVLETSHPPTWYIPTADIRMEFFAATEKTSYCEWKGRAKYWTVKVGGKTAEQAAWSYETPNPSFAAIRGFLAFYPSRFDCYVDEEKVQSQPGDFYGGWITRDVVGPFKGGAGSWGW